MLLGIDSRGKSLNISFLGGKGGVHEREFAHMF